MSLIIPVSRFVRAEVSDFATDVQTEPLLVILAKPTKRKSYLIHTVFRAQLFNFDPELDDVPVYLKKKSLHIGRGRKQILVFLETLEFMRQLS